MLSFLIPIYIFLTIAIAKILAECEINVRNIRPLPLFLDNTSRVLYPAVRRSRIHLEDYQRFSISCPGSTVLINNIPNETRVNAKCISETNLEIYDQIVDHQNIKCAIDPINFPRYNGETCSRSGREVEIGYDIGNNQLAWQIKICFDPDKQIPIHSYHTITASIGSHIDKIPRPFFSEDGFYRYGPVDNFFRRDTLRRTINNLVGLDPYSEKYIHSNGELFINRGHLTAKGDFVYGFQQIATFHYVNCAPQWASFNGGNWNEVEISVRNYAERTSLDIEVYTGVYGITTLPHEKTSQPIELYIHINDTTGVKTMPVPEIFWKVVYEPKSKRGVALIGINNPYEVSLARSIFCEDISDSITWVSWKKRDIQLGYSYACHVRDLKRVVSDVPDLRLEGLLL